MINNFKIFKKKKVLVTGNTGFKGSWLCLWLVKNGAKVLGISKNIPTNPSNYKILDLKNKISQKYIDICDYKKISKIIKTFQPDFVFHLAAQSLVKKSFENPLETWNTNTIGTLNILQSLRSLKKKTSVVIITSDKSYKNIEVSRGYKETDIFGGSDPYSASKGAAEFVIHSYLKSFFLKSNNKINIAIARAGNVIGGGDWSPDRIVPDSMKSFLNNKTLIIRNPKSTRPWQHVIEVIYGYLLLSSKLYKNNKLHGESFNFGPSINSNYNVEFLLKKIKKYLPNMKWKTINKKGKFFESKLLKLNSSKAKEKIRWKSILTIEESAKLVADWYKIYNNKGKNMYLFSIKQINDYTKKIEQK